MLYAVLGAIALHVWQHRGGQSVTQLGFGYGVLIQAIEETGDYRVPAGVHYPGVAFSAHRLPFIPFFVIGLSNVLGNDLGRVAFAKCLLFGGVLAFALGVLLKNCRAPLGVVLLAVGAVATMPRWVLNVFEVGLEEAYNIPVLALLFTLLWFSPAGERRASSWAVSIGLLLVLLVFLKSSMVYWCLAVPVVLWLRDRRGWTSGIVLGFVLAGFALLATFNARHSGRFTIGSSWEGWNLYKGNCEHTAALYPPYSLDILDYEGKVQAERRLVDEWDHNTYFRQRAVDFVRAHPVQFLELAARKAWVFFVEVRPTGLAHRGESRYASPQHLLQIPWMIVFRIALWSAIALALRTIWCAPRRADEWTVALTYLVFLALYSGFHVIGFAYERHVMPVVMPTVLYLLWRAGQRAETVTDATGEGRVAGSVR